MHGNLTTQTSSLRLKPVSSNTKADEEVYTGKRKILVLKKERMERFARKSCRERRPDMRATYFQIEIDTLRYFPQFNHGEGEVFPHPWKPEKSGFIHKLFIQYGTEY